MTLVVTHDVNDADDDDVMHDDVTAFVVPETERKRHDAKKYVTLN